MAAQPRHLWADLKETAHRYADRSGRPVSETWLLEPGLHALAWHRAAHGLYSQRFFLLARWFTQMSRFWTGIEIHAGARIGRRCLFLQGTGVVIGETAVIGDDCQFEAGALLLGAGLAPLAAGLRPDTLAPGEGFESGRHHPTLGDRVLVEAGAIVAGDVFIGHDVRVLAGAVVTRDIPDGGIAVGVPGRILPRAQSRPDPDGRAIQALAERLYFLEEQLQILAFSTQRQQGGSPVRGTRQPDQYGPIPAVEELIDGAGI